MASAWGAAWDSAWGNAWGSISTTPPDYIPSNLGETGGAGSGLDDRPTVSLDAINYAQRREIADEVRKIYEELNPQTIGQEVVREAVSSLSAMDEGVAPEGQLPAAEAIDWNALAIDILGLIEFRNLLLELEAWKREEEEAAILLLLM